MVFRFLAGALLVTLLAPCAGNPPEGASAARRRAAAASVSRRPSPGDASGGECVHAIVRGRLDRPLGIVQA